MIGGGGGGVQEVLREVLVPVVNQVAVEVPMLSKAQKEAILQAEIEASCAEGCVHPVPIKEVVKEVEVHRTVAEREVPIYTDRPVEVCLTRARLGPPHTCASPPHHPLVHPSVFSRA